MLIVSEIKENFQQFVEGLNKRGLLGVEQRLKEIIELDNQIKQLSEQNVGSKKIIENFYISFLCYFYIRSISQNLR